MTFLLALDQGTTSSRAILFRDDMTIAAVAQQEFAQHYPASGWVEHEPEDLWRSTLATAREALAKAGVAAGDIAGIGITNQRETTLVWDRATGEAIHRAIVWQDRRTADVCARLKREGAEEDVSARTGLLLDPYFSGTKIAWILENVPGARARAERGELAFGTVDSWLLWKLTGGKVHATDATNASRTLLFNIHRGEWDADLLRLLNVPRAILPDVMDCAADFGVTDPPLFGAPIAIRSQNRLLTTIAYQLKGKRTYALEGSIFVAGAAVQWLRDGLGIIRHASETGPLAEAADPTQKVYLVPAFVGLGAPFWDAEARAALYGMTRNTGPKELARAALESVCYQTLDLLDAMRADWPESASAPTVLRVDGGMTASDWTMQCLADILAAPVDRPTVGETTALGAAYLAGLAAGVLPEPERFADRWRLERRFTPHLDDALRREKIAGWRDAVGRTLSAR